MLNKAILMGRLTADPELRHTQNNIPVTSFTLAVDRTFGQDKQGSKRKSVEVVADEAFFAESKKDSAPRSGSDAPVPFDLPPAGGDFAELGPDDSELPF